LAGDQGYARQLRKMKSMLTNTVKKLGPRPYGDFVPGKGTNDAATSQKILDKLSVFHTTNGKKKK